MFKKFLAAALSAVMLMSLYQITAIAAEPEIIFELTAENAASVDGTNRIARPKNTGFDVEFVIKNTTGGDIKFVALQNYITYDTNFFTIEGVAAKTAATHENIGASEASFPSGKKIIKAVSSIAPSGDVINYGKDEIVFCTITLKIKDTATGSGNIKCGDVKFHEVAGSSKDVKEINLEVSIQGENYVPVTGVEVSPSEITLIPGMTKELTTTVNPDNATNKVIEYISSDTSVATVDSDGKIKAIAQGTATITAKSNNNKTDTCVVTVKNPTIEIGSVGTMYPEDEKDLVITFDPEIAQGNVSLWYETNNSAITFSSDKSKIIAGNVTQETTVRITITSNDYNTVNDYIDVTIKPNSISISPASASVTVGSTKQLSYTENMAEKNKAGVTFSSSDDSIATVDANGLVTGVRAGTVTITATSKFDSTLTATCTITVSSGGGGGGGGGGGVSSYKLTICTPDGEELKVETKTSGTTIKIADYTFTKEGYTFEGLFTDKELTKKAEDFKLTKATTLYAKFVEATVKPDRPSSIPSTLTDVHVAYIVGRGEGKVQPEASITRAEVATIFFRLLEDEIRDANYTKENDFTDVNQGDWFNTAVSTLAKLEIINGYDNGDGTYSFKPNSPITRAEYATIVARLAEAAGSEETKLVDISEHWAYENILKAASLGWIKGYEDSTFRPANNITRAEAMTLTNRVLCREPETVEDILSEQMTTFTDNADTSMWYYLAIQEATNSHEYKMKADGKHETWTKLTETPDWTKLEKE